VIGQKKGAVAVGAESGGFDNLGFKLVRDIEPGEILLIKNGSFKQVGVMPAPNPKICSFRWVYTDFVNSIIKGIPTSLVRKRLGVALARRDIKKGFIPHIVIPVPDSGRLHAIGYYQEFVRQMMLGKIKKIPFYDEYLHKYGFSRSFLRLAHEERQKTAHYKIVISGETINHFLKMLEEAGAYWVNWWNKPPDVKVTDYKYWVAHIQFDAVGQGYYNANELFKTFDPPNQGKIVAIQGMLANNAAIGRFQGLQKALKENPGVNLLQWEGAEWDTTKAYNATKALLAAYPDVDGVWCANDNMGMGAIQALKEAGLAGKVLVTGTDGNPEAFDAIKAGYMVSTEFQDSRYQAQFGLTMCLQARDGTIDVESLPSKYRSWMIPGVKVNRENVDEFVKEYIEQMPEYDLSDLFANWAGEAP